MDIPTVSLQCLWLTNIGKLQIRGVSCGLLKALTPIKWQKKRTVCVSTRRKSKHHAVINHLIHLQPEQNKRYFLNWVYKNGGFNEPANDFALSYCCPAQCGEVWVWQTRLWCIFDPEQVHGLNKTLQEAGEYSCVQCLSLLPKSLLPQLSSRKCLHSAEHIS